MQDVHVYGLIIHVKHGDVQVVHTFDNIEGTSGEGQPVIHWPELK